MQPFEKLGAFYLGKLFDAGKQSITDELLLYDTKDLTTHAVCVGMTGSGKTGLCLSLLEEAAIDGIPAIAIDPKGVIGEPAWEVGPYLYNNLPDEDDEGSWRAIIRSRADQFADELEVDRHRIYACSLAYAALSCAWSLEEGNKIERMAKRLAAIKELASPRAARPATYGNQR